MKRAQAVKCKCGNIIAACVEPACYTDRDWQKNIRFYAKKGYEISLIPVDIVRIELNQCICKKEK